MTKILYILTVSLIALGIMTSCNAENEVKQAQAERETQESGAVEKEAEPVIGREEFEGYLEKLDPIMDEFEVASDAYDSLRQSSADAKITNAEFAEGLRDDVVPKYMNQQERAEGITPPKLMRDTHEKFIELLGKNHQAMMEIVSAAELNDSSKITEANSLLTEAGKLEREFFYDIEDMEATFE